MDFATTIRRALEIVVEVMSPFVEQTVLEAFGPENARPLGPDPQVLLGTLLNNWRPTFESVLPAEARNVAFELRTSRNLVAHHRPVGFDDAYRAVDSAVRLVSYAGLPMPAELSRLKRELIAVAAGTLENRSPAPGPEAGVAPDSPGSVPYGALGALWMPGPGARNESAFEGVLRCPQCMAQVRVVGKRYLNPPSDRAPQFLLWDASRPGTQVGHLFLGKIRTSPKLLYGGIKHCEPETWVAAFFNRSYAGSGDHHLVLVEAAAPAPPTDSDFPF